VTTLSANQIADHAYRAGFRGQALTIAVAVALAESGGRTDVPGDTALTDSTWGPSIGLWQIRSLWTDKGTGRQRDEKANLDPATNARHAYQISGHGRSFQPWSTYTNGAYKSHLGVAGAAARHAAEHHGSGDHSGGGHGGGGHGGGGGRGTNRIVLDEKELARLHDFFTLSTQRIRHVRRALTDIAHDIEPARSALPDPALAGLIARTFEYLDSADALPKAEERMDWHARFAARVRTMVDRADGADNAWSSREISRFTTAHGHRPDLAEGLVLAALRGRHVRLAGHLAPHPGGHHTLPRAQVGGLRNGHVPAARLTGVGYGERLLTPVAREYRRMAAAARTAGVSLPLNDGYRTYDEQVELYRRYRNGTGNLAALPGHSTHGLGLSVDIGTANPKVVPWLRAHAATYGFVNDVPSESWHWTYTKR
jgi:lysozyme-like protein/D-alanyl-D-alanine carboxypeptidase-like protein